MFGIVYAWSCHQINEPCHNFQNKKNITHAEKYAHTIDPNSEPWDSS